MPADAATPAARKPKASVTKSTTETKKEEKSTPVPATAEPAPESFVDVSPEELVEKPQEYLNKNVKFTGKFFAFSSLALDYKPALRPSKTHLSFLILRSHSHIPLSELKLAFPIPKEKDPNNAVISALKDGDTVELSGKVFSTALGEPWVDVLHLKKIGGSEEKTAQASDDNKDKEKETDSKRKGPQDATEHNQSKP